MGKDYTPIKLNGLDLEDTYNKIFSGQYRVISASEERYFFRIPSLREVDEIEVGYAGTKESIIRLNDGGFVVVNKTIKI